ncbi:MAG: sodium:solute symporter family protein [Planctomycetota bacterium]|nr:sodium:solute symporter family protein [Planctomycetota bacterium]
MTGIDYAIVIGFLAVMGLGGFFLSRLIKDADDFMVAGRELTPFILCAAITATNLSMLHVVGMGGTAYQNGVSIMWQNFTGCMALVISGIFVLPIMRRLRIRSVPEFLQMRYSGPLRVLVAAFWGLRLSMFMGILLYLAGTVARDITGWDNYLAWLLIFCVVAIFYSAIGGAWAVAIMDSVLFVVTLLGGLILLPVAVYYAGGLPEIWGWLQANPHLAHPKKLPTHTHVVPTEGSFNWVFICGIMLLSIKFATVDQAILQRAFGAKSPRVGAKGMVFSAIVTAPIALFCILPGIAMAKLHPVGLHPELMNPDLAIPMLLKTYLPMAGHGLLGIVLCGLVASQVDTITSDVNSVATLFTSDVYRNLKRRPPTQRELLFVVRLSSVLCGVLMLGMAWVLQYTGTGAVNLNLAVVGILDMPLFIITIVYGLFWRRANWQGATAGFVAGGIVGVMTYVILEPQVNRYMQGWLGGAGSALAGWHDHFKGYSTWVRALAPITSSVTALIVTPIVSLLTPPNRRASAEQIWRAYSAGGPEQPGETRSAEAAAEAVHDTFHLIPTSVVGRAAALVVLTGFAVFLFGVFSSAWGSPLAGELAIAGMLTVFAGGFVRVYAE